MNVSLTPQLDKFVANKVASGRYTSASEVIREALRLLEEQDRLKGEKFAAFNREVAKRLESLDRGENVSAARVRTAIDQKSRRRRELIA